MTGLCFTTNALSTFRLEQKRDPYRNTSTRDIYPRHDKPIQIHVPVSVTKHLCLYLDGPYYQITRSSITLKMFRAQDKTKHMTVFSNNLAKLVTPRQIYF